ALDHVRRFSDVGATDERFAEIIDDLLDDGPTTMPERKPKLPWYSPHVLKDLHYSNEVAERGITEAVAAELGIGLRDEYTKRNYTGPAIIIPHWFEGNLTGWQARLTGDVPDDQPRHDNTPDLPKSDTLYGWDLAQDADVVFVVESPMTV